MNRKIVAKLVVAVSFFTSSVLFAGTTGKIRGYVTDAESGEPLPGVNVIVSGIWDGNIEKRFTANIGAATQIQGEYIILKVQPLHNSLN